jgi:hypothetical protein
MERKKILTKFKPGHIPWNKGLDGYGKGRHVSLETREKLRISSSGRMHSEESKKKMSESHSKLTGCLNPFYGKKHSDKSIVMNRESAMERWNDPGFRDRVMLSRKGTQNGEKNPRWKGGVTPLNSMIRHCDKYFEWVNSVFTRDDFTCQECGVRGSYLEAHHEKRFSKIMDEFLFEYNQFSPIEDRETLFRLAMKYKPFWDLENGKTMCSKCHNETKGAIHGA